VIDMPTRSPDNVTEHRITLGRWERERIKGLHEAKVIKDVGTGVGIAAVGIGGTYVAYRIGKSIYDWVDDGIATNIAKAILPEGWENEIDAIDEMNTNSEATKNISPLQSILWRIVGW
jgi:hypothetical protein